jgi:hypothetical protein
MYASFLGISEALHLDIFHQPLRNRFFDSLVRPSEDAIVSGFKSPVDLDAIRGVFEGIQDIGVGRKAGAISGIHLGGIGPPKRRLGEACIQRIA